MKVLETLEDVLEVFALQLEQAKKTSGDYLNGRTLKEVAEEYHEMCKTQFFKHEMSYKEAESFILKKVTEFEEFKGQAQLFYMVKNISAEEDGSSRVNLEICKIWESQLAELVGLKFTGVMSLYAGSACPTLTN